MRHDCINHSGVPSTTMCFQCHKPICKSCVVVMPQGEFCSTECNAQFKLMKEALKAKPALKPSKLIATVTALLIVLGLTVLYHFGIGFLAEGPAKEKLQRFDVWTIFMSALQKADKLKDKPKP